MIEITDECMFPTAGREIIANARFSQRAAADGNGAWIEHVAGTELRGHRRIDLEVGVIRVQRVMERREARVLVVRVGHAGQRQTPAIR
jgi:hypothetical protein